MFPLGDKDITLAGVSGELAGCGVEGGATPTNCVRPVRGEEALSGIPWELGGGLNICWLGDTLGTLDEVLELGEQLSVKEVGGFSVIILEMGPGVLTWGRLIWLDCVD